MEEGALGNLASLANGVMALIGVVAIVLPLIQQFKFPLQLNFGFPKVFVAAGEFATLSAFFFHCCEPASYPFISPYSPHAGGIGGPAHPALCLRL